MSNRFPHLRPGQAALSSFGSRRASARRLGYPAIVAGGCALVFAASWIATPNVQQWWARTSRSEPSAAVETVQDPEAAERSVYFSGCSEARAAGAAPIHRGSPGYRAGMDGDGDGVACESYGGSSGGGGYSFRRHRRRH
ncbi:excalibur calcium-binding domain-containing protein [Sphingomonas sp. ACRSK]|uniref:excalibur calcium-binding domain-containing protein n=1 Tax=Sphingomonas sp. ACRSK TaxID=2918213 RepID=UPI001EF67C8D|nr:excalibur calcium-binding domain-containing protein [Sphingomonas sp. ACRSK]MCG7349983.1 excalibur calcium-binding domain-containing protein [Sphingomonas sp. ACRSK]